VFRRTCRTPPPPPTARRCAPFASASAPSQVAVQTGDLRIDGDPNAARRVTRLLRTPIGVDSGHFAAHSDLAQFRHLAGGRHGR
jgi:hypothetical protein